MSSAFASASAAAAAAAAEREPAASSMLLTGLTGALLLLLLLFAGVVGSDPDLLRPNDHLRLGGLFSNAAAPAAVVLFVVE